MSLAVADVFLAINPGLSGPDKLLKNFCPCELP